MSDHHIVTPRGSLHRECVRSASDSTPIVRKHLSEMTDPRAVAPATPAGWIESATFTPSVPLGSMSVRWKVPEPPKERGSLIYLFPGAQGPKMRTILQPVLQWGFNGDFGGDFWSIASWYCSDDTGAVRSDDWYKVKENDTIVGTLQGTRSDDDRDNRMDWTVVTQVEGDDSKVASLTKYDLDILFLFVIAGALEGYDRERQPLKPTRANMSYFPASGSTAFEDIKLADIADRPFIANWHARHPLNGDCAFSVTLSDSRRHVTLNY